MQLLQELGYNNSFDSFMVIPLTDIAGNKTYQIRIDNSPENYSKYLVPPGSKNILDIPPGYKEAAKRTATTLIITEGAKKADSINSALTPELNAVAVSLTGVFNYRNSDTGILEELEELGLKNRQVIISFDSDYHDNKNVQLALFRLSKILKKRKAHVKMFIPQAIAADGKTGIDDYLATAEDEAEYITRTKAIFTQAVDVPDEAEEPIKFNITNLADVEDTPLEYLLEPYLEVGHLSMLYGRGGVGKSLLTTYLAGILSKQGIRSFWLDAEEQGADIKRRANSANVDLTNIDIADAVINESTAFNISNPAQIDQLFEELKKYKSKLLIINTITSFMLNTDSNNEAQIKQALLYLTHKLDKHNISGLGIHHINKNTSYTNSSYRMQGSSAFHDVPRKVFGICSIEDETGAGRELRAVGIVKANNAAELPPTEHELLVNDGIPFLKPTGLILPHDFHYYMNEADRAASKTKEVKEKILELLEDKMESNELRQIVLSQFQEQPSQRTYDRAIRELKDRGIIYTQKLQAPNGRFVSGNTIFYKANPTNVNGKTEQTELNPTEVNNRYAKNDDKEFFI